MTGPSTGAGEVSRLIDTIARKDHGRLLSTLVGSLRDFQLAEDCLQDALESALVHWRRNGAPASPQGWLLQVARRKAIDRLRRRSTFGRKSAEVAHLIEMLAAEDETEAADPFGDERLKLIFTCCHPALDRKTCVALTLRSVCGLKTEEVADAFLDTPDAMAQRLVRARHKIAKAGIAYEIPEPADWPGRIENVLAVIYLMFNEGYAASGETFLRRELCEEAIRVARLLVSLCPRQPEIEGLLALMLLHHARRETRLDGDGALVSLEAQDRSLWRREEIAEGSALVERALRRGDPGPYQLQAAIASIHAEAASFETTDWREITLLYDVLSRRFPNPVHDLNRIVALSYADGPEVALGELRPLANVLATYQPFHAAHADLLRRTGRLAEAEVAFTLAISLSQSDSEKIFLSRRKAACGSRTSDAASADPAAKQPTSAGDAVPPD